jgi:ATP-dependent Clp protease ATP-binding subunit ClpX
MVGGAFEGMDELLMKRVHKDNYSLGFKQTTNHHDGNHGVIDSVRHQLNPDDLMEFGFITEFVGRLPVLVTLDELTKDDLVRILTEPKNAFVEQYKALFRMEEVKLNFSEEALSATAEKAIEQKTGARGLRTILESTLMEVMFELPSMSGITHCDVEADAIIGDTPVKLSNEGSEIIELATLEKKSA